jgi:adenylylsulfate kinase-like enzyme
MTAPYEEPLTPEIIIETGMDSVADALSSILNLIDKK